VLEYQQCHALFPSNHLEKWGKFQPGYQALTNMNPTKRPNKALTILSGFSKMRSWLALLQRAYVKCLFLFHAKINPAQVLFKPKVCMFCVNI